MTTLHHDSALNHRLKMRSAISLTSRLCVLDEFTKRADVVARVEVDSDIELERLLRECSEFWEFDAADKTVILYLGRDDVRLEIGVDALEADHVWHLLHKTEPVF